jgi:starch phosphorylase
MEVGIVPEVPTYAGGLGVLAGDTLWSAADLNSKMVGVTLLYRAGYFHQKLDTLGRQLEQAQSWEPEENLTELPVRVAVQIGGAKVLVRGWKYEIHGLRGVTPVYFLDTDLPENSAEYRSLTGTLYGGSPRYRLMQEIVLGVGGVRYLHALGYPEFHRYHMNEGHAALLGLELFHQQVNHGIAHSEALETVRRHGVFTTHTPVEAGHDRFPISLVEELLEPALLRDLHHLAGLRSCITDGLLNMTRLGAAVSHFVNGVSRRHAEVSQRMFPDLAIHSITNGVHAVRWAHPAVAKLYDRFLSGWRRDPAELRRAVVLPKRELWEAHQEAKRELLRGVADQTGLQLDQDRFTVGLARRATAYKRLDLLFESPQELRALAATFGGLTVLMSGKAHPHDGAGKKMIERLTQIARDSLGELSVVFLPDYSLKLAGAFVQGVDLWLNTPTPPLEASGTSGMKAAMNGVPSLSTLDGWWLEGWIEGVTGWAIGPDRCADVKTIDLNAPAHRREDSQELLKKLSTILGCYYQRRDEFLEVMRQTIAINGSYFHSQRLVQDYTSQAYC